MKNFKVVPASDDSEAASPHFFRQGQAVVLLYVMIYMFLRFTTVIEHRKTHRETFHYMEFKAGEVTNP